MYLLMLGTGTPNLEPTRYQSSLAIVTSKQAYIVDCGGGTVQRLSQARAELSDQLDITPLQNANLTRLFLTHLHPDHTAGLADFMIAPWVESRSDELQIYGATGTTRLVTGILNAYEIGIAEHRDGLAPIKNSLQINAQDVDEGEIYRDDDIVVDALHVSHGGLHALAFKFSTEGKTIVVSGDTCPVPAMVEFAKSCDILVHEVYSAKQFETRPIGWQAYHRAVHTSTIELAELATAIQPRQLVLTHQLLWGTDLESLRQEITAHYNGHVMNGVDLGVYTA